MQATCYIIFLGPDDGIPPGMILDVGPAAGYNPTPPGGQALVRNISILLNEYLKICIINNIHE